MLHPFFKYSLWTFLTSIIVIACKDSELNNISPEQEGDCEIAFGSKLTKAPVNTITDMADFKVWGWAHKDNGKTITQLFNATKVNAQTGSYEGVQYWKNGHTHDFFAVHPHGIKPTVTQDGALTLTAFDAKEIGVDAIDLMTASNKDLIYDAVTTPQPAPVALQFAHELAKVEFSVKSLQSADVTSKLFGINHIGNMTKEFKGTPVSWTSAWTFETANTASNTPFKREPAFNVPLFVEGTSTPLPLFNGLMLLPPQPLKETTASITGATLQLTYTYSDNHTVTKDINLYNIKNITQWEAGKSYHYEITIPKRTFDINITVQVTDWNNKDISTIL